MKKIVLISSFFLMLLSACHKNKDDQPEEPETPETPDTSTKFHLEWEKKYGGSDEDHLYSMAPSANGGYVLVGTSRNYDGDLAGLKGPMWLINVDSNGNKLWTKEIQGSAVPNAITPSKDGGYFIIGSGKSDMWFCKINGNGDTLWTKYLHGSNIESAGSILATADGGALVSGYVTSTDGDYANIPRAKTDYNWVAKINSNGALVWQKITDIKKATASFLALSNNTYIVVNGNHIIKIDESGNELWNKPLGHNPSHNQDYTYSSVIKTTDGGFIAVGHTPISYDKYGYPGPEGDVCVAKTDSEGKTIWEKKYGGSNKDDGLAVANTENGYIISAKTGSADGDATGNPIPIIFSNTWFFKLNTRGSIVWSSFYGTIYTEFKTIIPLPGNYFVAGGTSNVSGNIDGWMIKFKDQPK